MIASSAIAAGAAALQDRMVVMERAGHAMTSRGRFAGPRRTLSQPLATAGFNCLHELSAGVASCTIRGFSSMPGGVASMRKVGAF
jgi:hypothetical protein